MTGNGDHPAGWSLGASALQPFRDLASKDGRFPSGGGTGSYPPRDRGVHRKMRQKAYRPPRKMPCRAIASIAYSEQVGTNRQAGGSMGEMQYLYIRMGKMAMHRNSLVIPVSSGNVPLNAGQNGKNATSARKNRQQRYKLLFDNGKRNMQRVQRPFWHDHNVAPGRQARLVQPEKLANHALDPVAKDRASCFAGHGESETPNTTVIPIAHEKDEMFRIVATAGIVAKQYLGSPAHTVLRRLSHTASLLRPLARLRRRMARPLGVLMRSRKP